MKSSLRKKFVGALLALGVLVIWGGVSLSPAQEKYPVRPINLIVTTAAGGGQDMTARALQPHLDKALGTPVLIINKAGAGNAIGLSEIANAAADGYTIGQASPSMNIIKYTMKAGIDYLNYEPIAFGGYSPSSLLVRKDAPWKNLKEILDYARANPGKLRVGNSGTGAIFHISAIGMEHAAKVKFIHVPYKGTSPSFPAILGGHIDAIVTGITDTFPLIKANKLKVLGVASAERSKFVPEAQTFRELGMNAEFATFYSWISPKGVTGEKINILVAAFKKALETREFKSFCDSQGVTIDFKGPRDLARFFELEDQKWKELVSIGGIKPE